MVGRRRIARLMRDNGLRARQKRRFKLTTDSHQSWLEILSFNVLLGWTVLGWIGALIWSLTAPRWETTVVATERFRGEMIQHSTDGGSIRNKTLGEFNHHFRCIRDADVLCATCARNQ